MNVDTLKDELKRDEGLRLKPYLDSVGKATIGVGRNLADVGITEQEAMVLLSNDIAAVVNQLDANLPWWRKETDARQRALANLCFNLGIHGLLGFRNTLAAWQSGRYQDAAHGLLQSKWAGQVGSRAVRLASMVENG